MPEYNYPDYAPTVDNILTLRPDAKGGYHGGNDNRPQLQLNPVRRYT
jgi:hypothetical protein